METEAKAKVVANVWGAEFIQFLAALDVLPRSIWKNRMECTNSMYRSTLLLFFQTCFPSSLSCSLCCMITTVYWV